MPVTHDPWLVGLSIIVAIQGAYVGLSLSTKIASAAGLKRRLLLAAAAVSLAVTIWSMHFVGMLAARLPFPVDYLVLPTLVSFLVCAIVVGGALFAVASGPLRPLRLLAAAAFMGGGIASMHYMGMQALHASALMDHSPALVAASLMVAIAASGLALWLAAGRDGRPPLLLSAAALVLAIASMHYTAMAGLRVFPLAHPQLHAPVLSTDLLAVVVAVVAFLVSGVFLLTLLPDAAGDERPAEEQPVPSAFSLCVPITIEGARAADCLPFEQDGETRYLAVDSIVAVHANAHYTYLFDGVATRFCPLAIGEIESRLDRSRFIRVHRSHIVNIDRVRGLKRAGDNGVLELVADKPCTVPVSRGRLSALKARLGPPIGRIPMPLAPRRAERSADLSSPLSS